MTVVRLIRDGVLPAKQSCPGAPYVIKRDDLDRVATGGIAANRCAVSQDLRQKSLMYE
jgi:hypothetical protein